MRILVLCDDYWHPARTPREGLELLLDHGFTFDFIEDAKDWSAEKMGLYPVVILTKSNNISSSDQTGWVTDEVQSAFANYVRQGNGLLAIHSGMAGYAEKPILRGLLGGVFLQHPPQCEVTMEPRSGLAITSGSSPFTLKDEHYHMALDDQKAEVILSTTSEHGTQPGGWIRVEDQGRVCVLTPGHTLEIWKHPSYQVLIANALRWCCKEN